MHGGEGRVVGMIHNNVFAVAWVKEGQDHIVLPFSGNSANRQGQPAPAAAAAAQACSPGYNRTLECDDNQAGLDSGLQKLQLIRQNRRFGLRSAAAQRL
jgi:hypothetical protein